MRKFIVFWMWVCVFGWLAATGVQAQAQVNIRVTQVDTSRFPQVDVYISVTDASGNPVRHISPSAFRVTENGAEMSLTSVTRAGEQGAVNTILIIDRSGSMAAGDKMVAAKQAASTFVNLMRPGDKTALIQFDTEIETLQTFTDDKARLLAAIQKIFPRGNTALYDALDHAARYFETVQGRKAIIVLTDGMDTASKLGREAIVQRVSHGGFSVYTVGLGARNTAYGSQEGVDEEILRELANVTYGNYYYSPDGSQLSELYQQLSFLLQNEYKLTYLSPNPLRDGVKRNIVVTAMGAGSTRTEFNPGGVIPEVATQATSWILFFVVLAVLLALLLVPAAIHLLRARGVALPTVPTSASAPQKPSRIKLTGEAPPAGTAQPKSRIKIKQSSSDTARPMPWDENPDGH